MAYLKILFQNSLGENEKKNLHESTQYQSGKNSNRHIVNRLWSGEDPHRHFSSTAVLVMIQIGTYSNPRVHLCRSGFK